MSLPYFPMFPTDFEAKTSHLTLEEDGAYNRLLRLCWMTPGCSLPDDPAWIARRMRVDMDTFNRVVGPLLDEFFRREKGRVFSQKLMLIHQEANVKHERRVDAGKKGGRPPKSLKNNETEESNAKALPKQPEPEPEPKVKDSISYEILAETAPRDGVPEAVEAYNKAALRQGWPAVQKLNDTRRKALKQRLKDCGGIDGWAVALEKAEASDFLCARTAKAWTGFGFDWLTKAANFTKLMEGNYDNRSSQPGAAAPGSSDAFLRAAARAAGAF